MKRLALAAVLVVAAIAAAGCGGGSHAPSTGSVILYWDFVRTAPAQTGGAVTYDASFTGAADGQCPQSGVEEVTVDAPGLAQVALPCVYGGVQGVTMSGLAAGTNTIRVRGWRGSYAVYDGSFSVDVPRSNVQPPASYLDVPAVSAPLDLFAALYTTDTSQFYTTCGGTTGNPTIEYDVWDSFGTLVLSGAVACGEPPYPSFPVFVGDLDLDNYTVRMQGFVAATRVFDSCTSATAKLMAFDHFGAQTGAGGVPITLSTPPACTP